MPVVELFALNGGHVYPRGFEGGVEHIICVQVYCAVEVAVQLAEQSAGFHVVGVSGVKVVYVAVEDSRIHHGVLHVRTALLTLGHHEKSRPWQRAYEPPVIRIARNNDERIHALFVVLLTCSSRQHDVYERLCALDALDRDVIHWYVRKAFEDAPRACCVYVVKEDDALYLGGVRPVQIL